MTAPEEIITKYAQLRTDAPPTALEEEMLRLWATEGLFDKIGAAHVDDPEWVFYEGPPTANGRPGIHHVFSRTIKDLFCRHRVMQGHHVARKAGWDTHGLPVEIEVEKQLGISGKRDIERIGVERFNALCRESVWKYKDEWEKLSTRIGFDLDYRDPYVTYSLDYVESVWWALKTLFDRELLYRGHKVLPYCPRCGTALSSHEVAQGYREVDDPSVYLALELSSATPHSPLPGPRILVWTTTPWTLVSNAALAVNPELIYIELAQRDGDAAHGSVILAEARAAAVLGDDYADRWEIVGRQLGRELAGRRYRRPIDWVDYAEGEREVIIAEPFVSGEDGTGVVHMSPAFGTDDYAAGKRHGLAFLQPVNLRGEFPEGTPVIGGKFVKAADPVILEELRKRGLLWRAERLRHSYPHCWRCDTPLLYYARESWFVRTTAFKDQLLSRNARVNWQPEDVGEGRFGEWLKNNIDWALSRDRYWGTPLPIWVCDADRAHIEAVGGYAELAERLGAPLPSDFDPHKPFIDRYSWLCAQHRDGSKCGGTMRRAPEVIDTWFDSGSMPFAQWHYPFENRESVERQYPADFIAEGLDQTRGWFYSLLAIATGLGDALPNNVGSPAESFGHMAAPFRAAVVNGLVLDAEGQKMSKTRGNTVEPWEVIQRHGADALRLFLVASSQVWLPKQFDEDTIRETAGRFLLTLKNTYSGMFAQYANYGWAPSELDPAVEDRPVIDRWIVSRISTVEREVDGFLERLEPTLALRAVMDFLVDDVSNWYVRQSRFRFYDVDGDENRAAFATLHEVLVVTCRLLAPFAPFVSDWVHRELTGSSVHLASYTRADSVSPDRALEVSMRQLRVLATLGRAAREEAGIKVRQPLAKLVCVIPPPAGSLASQLLPLLRAELNVKSVEFVSSGAEFVRLEAKPSFRVLGKRFGKRTPLAAQAIAALSDRALREFESGVQVGITIDGETHVLQDDDFAIVHRAAGELVVKEEGGYFAALDIAVTPELRAEGLARELVSRVQRMRKEAGLDVSDRIMLWVNGDKQVERAASDFQDYISAEVLARQVVIGGEPVTPNNATQMVDLDGSTVSIALLRTN
ncbi:MAG: isoleucine--tRNA ligase [Gemmatimonadaceae bacterium]